MPGDRDEELRRVSSGWGRRPPQPAADPYAIERDTERARPTDEEREAALDPEREAALDPERARPTDEELDRAGEAGAVSGPASSRTPAGIDPGPAPDDREG